MGFVDNLRMAGIYGPQGNAPVGNFGSAPDFNMGNVDPMSIIGTIAALRKKQADDEMYRQQNMMAWQHRQQQQDQTYANRQKQLQPDKPMDVNPPVYADQKIEDRKGMTDFQKAQVDLEGKKLKQAGDIAAGKDQNADADRQIKSQRANTYQFAQTHKNAQIMAPKGGNFQLYDPATKEVHDSGIPTGTMTQEAFQEMVQSGRETITGMQGENQANVQNMRNQGALADIAARTAGQKAVQDNKPTPYANATQDRTTNWNNAQKVINTRTDLAPFLQVGTNGQFSITPPSEGYFGHSGPTAAQYQELNDLIYGKKPTTTTAPAPKKPVTTPAQDSKWSVEIK